MKVWWSLSGCIMWLMGNGRFQREVLRMMLYESKSGYKKINIWKDEMPVPCKKQKFICLNKMANNHVCWYEEIICIEALLGPWHASNYAMVYMKYSSNVRRDVNIKINYGVENIPFPSKYCHLIKNKCWFECRVCGSD